MFSLLDPRFLLACIGAAALVFLAGYFKGHGDGVKVSEARYAHAVSEANREARATEQRRQRNVDDAATVAAARQRNLLVSAANARNERDGLLDALRAYERAAADSLTASNNALRVTSELLGSCTREYLSVAESADRADSEARELRAAWPR